MPMSTEQNIAPPRWRGNGIRARFGHFRWLYGHADQWVRLAARRVCYPCFIVTVAQKCTVHGTDRQTDRGITASLNAQFTPPTRQDKTSCLAWRCELAFTGGRRRHAVCKRNAADAVQRSVARVRLQGQTARTMPSQLATSRRGAVMPSSSHCCATVSVCLEASTRTWRRSVKVRVKVTRREGHKRQREGGAR